MNQITATNEGSGTILITYLDGTAEVPYTIKENYESLEILPTGYSGGPGLSADVGDKIVYTARLTHVDSTVQEITREDGLEISGPGFYSGVVETNDGQGGTKKANALYAVDAGEGSLTFRYKSKTVTLSSSVAAYQFGSRRLLDNSVLSMRAYSYSGYRNNQSPNNQTYPSVAEIAEDLVLLDKANIHFLRLYDTSTHARRTLQAISESGKNFKVQLGVWIAGADATHGLENLRQLDGAVELVQQYPGIIASVSVGNECMVDWNTWAPAPPEDIRKYIQYVRSNVSVPVTPTTTGSLLPNTT